MSRSPKNSVSSATSLKPSKSVLPHRGEIVHALHALQMSASESGALAAGLRCGGRVGNHRLERPALLLPNLSSSLNGSPCGIRAASSDEEDHLRTRPNRGCRHESRCLIWPKPSSSFVWTSTRSKPSIRSSSHLSSLQYLGWPKQRRQVYHLGSISDFGGCDSKGKCAAIRVRTRSDRSNTRLQS